jgi:S-(hydroxymethyl)glutathione dehydrogenase/alcohol dehydrogenase
MIELGYRITKPQGRVVLVGVPRKGNNTTIYSLPLHFGKQISGSHGGEAVPNTDIPRYMNLYRSGGMRLKEIISQIYSLDEINHAIEDMKSGELSGRALVRLNL